MNFETVGPLSFTGKLLSEPSLEWYFSTEHPVLCRLPKPSQKMMNVKTITTGILASIIAASVLAGEVDVSTDGTLTWKAGVDGVEIEWNADGSVRRLYSRYSTPVEFADRRGIAKAQIIGEEKAKANIIRFMNQNSTSTRVVTEVQSDINRATQNRETGKDAKVNKIDERVILESLTEVTTSFASGNLRGVIALERGYDEKLEEAWVTVGISDKTINAARDVQSMIENASRSSPTNNSSDMGLQADEARQTKQKNW